MRKPTRDYLEKARTMSTEETERLLARTRSKWMRRIEDRKMSVVEVVAIQLEIEDEELQEWRERMAEINRKAKS